MAAETNTAAEFVPASRSLAHPSAILRLRDHDEREEALAGLVDDLRLVASAAGTT